MFSNPTMLDDLDYLYKSDTARKLMFYYQDDKPKEDPKTEKRHKRRGEKSKEPAVAAKKVLTVEDGTDTPLTGVAIYLLRTSTKRTLGYVQDESEAAPYEATMI